MKTPCKRKCWNCGKVAMHTDDITPDVCCQLCGSQDTRLVRDRDKPRTVSLADGIKLLTDHACSTHRLADFRAEIGVVLAAAKAFSCPVCDGTGRIYVAAANTELDCTKCKASRTIAKEGCS